MKRIMVYTVAAILLGIITMLAPFGLFVGKMNEEGSWLSEPADTMAGRATSETLSEETEGKFAAAMQITHPLNMSFISFMILFSLIVALSITFYFRRRIFRSSLP